MRFTIITHVEHKKVEGKYYAYLPYVREMNLWLNHVDEVEVVAPLCSGNISKIDTPYDHSNLKFRQIPSIQFTSLMHSVGSILKLPFILFSIFRACLKSDHIHLRCPGNIGLLGCFIQMLFPKKLKTAKYAGNWDSNSKQPWSYKLQQHILANTALTKNMKVLVYGEWEDQTKNIKSFFTASFRNNENVEVGERNYKGLLKFVFVGSLVKGKRPLFAIKVIQRLREHGVDACLELFGDGIMKDEIDNYIETRNVSNFIKVRGNQTTETLKHALMEGHFIILPSKSEGWPKALAEGMFFGAIPIGTKISCVPYMLGHGSRGLLIPSNIEKAVKIILDHITDENKLKEMSRLSCDWSRKFTLDTFEQEIVKLLKN